MNKVTDKELVGRIAKDTGYSKKEVKEILRSYGKVVVGALANDEQVTHHKFGVYKFRNAKERVLKGGLVKETVIPAHKVVRLQFASSVKTAVK